MGQATTYSCEMGNEADSDNSRRTSRRTFFAAGGSGLAMTLALRPAGMWAAWQMTPGTEALELAERRRGELMSLLSELVAVRSHSGEPAERAQSVVTQYLAALPYRVEVTEDVPSRLQAHPEFMPPSPPGDGPFVNVVAHPEDGAGAPFGVFSHIDTEVPGEGWGTDPYQVTRVDGRLHGVGTADDKGGVAAMLVASAALHEMGSPLPTVMSLHGKGGGSRGSLPVFERFARAGTNFGARLAWRGPRDREPRVRPVRHRRRCAACLLGSYRASESNRTRGSARECGRTRERRPGGRRAGVGACPDTSPVR